MYYIITPKKKQTYDPKTALSARCFAGDGDCNLQLFSDSPLFGVRYKLPDGKLIFMGGTIEPLTRITKKRITLHHVVWQVTEEFPEYIKIETIFEKVLRRLFRKIGAFDVYVIPLDRTFKVKDEETADSVALALADSYPEIYRENEEIRKDIEKDPDVEKVVEKLNKFEAPYATILAKLYAFSHSDANTLNAKIMDTLVEQIFTRLEEKKWRHIRSFLIYKFMHGVRWLRSGFLQHVSPKVLARIYLGIIEKCSLNLETTQFLVNDLIFTGINKAQDPVYREIKNQLILRIRKMKGVAIFAPEVLSYYELERTGNKEKTLDIYMKYNDRKIPANEYRKQIHANFPTLQFTTGYLKSTIKETYQSVPFTNRMKYVKLMPALSSAGQNKPIFGNNTGGGLISLILTVVSIIGTGIACFAYMASIRGNNYLAYWEDSGNIVSVMIGMGLTFGFIVFFVFWLLETSIRNIRKNPDKNKQLINGVLFGAFAAPFLVGIIAFFLIMEANISVSESTVIGVTETHIMRGLDWYAFSDLSEIHVSTSICSYLKTSSCSSSMTLELIRKNSTYSPDIKYTQPLDVKDKTKLEKGCKVVRTIFSKAEEKGIKIVMGTGIEYKKVLTQTCDNKQSAESLTGPSFHVPSITIKYPTISVYPTFKPTQPKK